MQLVERDPVLASLTEELGAIRRGPGRLVLLASSASITVTPSGHVHVRSEYPAAPLRCE
jgi:hypothetical protein